MWACVTTSVLGGTIVGSEPKGWSSKPGDGKITELNLVINFVIFLYNFIILIVREER